VKQQGDIILFYNKVFVPKIKHFLLSLKSPPTRTGTGTGSVPPSPLPQPRTAVGAGGGGTGTPGRGG
jgi:hypothetical protein